jgi:hypothetical protein
MFRYFNTTGMILIAAFCCLVLNGGCQSAGVIVGEEPTYGHEPPAPPAPPREPGPPPWAPAHGYRAKHRYHYYPSSYVYYDTARSLYFYYDGGNWQASVSLPTSIHVDINDYVSLEMNTDRPYEYHREVTKKYPPGHQKQRGKRKGKGRSKWD